MFAIQHKREVIFRLLQKRKGNVSEGDILSREGKGKEGGILVRFVEGGAQKKGKLDGASKKKNSTWMQTLMKERGRGGREDLRHSRGGGGILKIYHRENKKGSSKLGRKKGRNQDDELVLSKNSVKKKGEKTSFLDLCERKDCLQRTGGEID